jgi:hypothetical protein
MLKLKLKISGQDEFTREELTTSNAMATTNAPLATPGHWVRVGGGIPFGL